MCLVALAVEPRGVADADGDPLVFALAANRDEMLARGTAPLARWGDAPRVFGGRDLDKGGTWLGVREDGRFALVTNYRDFRRAKPPSPPSRGALVAGFLRGDEAAPALVARLAEEGAGYEPYNLVVGDLRTRALEWCSNVGGAPRRIERGRVHGLSNALLDTPWPKVTALSAALTRSLEAVRSSASAGGREGAVVPVDAADLSSLERALLDALASRTEAPPTELPDTGVPPDVERALSSAFVRFPGYGTRCSSIITLTESGRLSFLERTYDEGGAPVATRRVVFRLR